MTYYTSMDYYADQYDRGKRTHAFTAASKEEFTAWKASARARLREISGLELCAPVRAEARLLESGLEFGVRRDTMLLETEPGILTPFWLFRPETPNGAAVLFPHGHGGGKETTLRLITEGKPFIQDLAERGYYVLCPDARGSGQRRELPQQDEEHAKGNSHRELSHIAMGFGGSVIGMLVWDLMRLTDYLLEGLGVRRVGCAGMSGGGQQTLWLTALDDRISAAISSGYYYGVKESLIRLPSNCDCNFVPFFWNTMDIGDLGALIAPRPLYVESGRADRLNGAPGLDNVYPQIETANKAYRLWGAEPGVEHHVHEGGHQWVGAGAREFLDRHLLGLAEGGL